MNNQPNKYNVMIGPITNGKGGISTVVKQYEANDYFPVLQSRYLISWEEKGGIGKISVALRAARQLLGLLLKREVKGIHLQGSCRASFFRKSLYIAIANLFGVPTIFHLHSGEFYDIYDASHNPLFKWWLRSTLNRTSSIVLLTESWRPLTIPLIKDPAKISVVANPMSLPLPANFTRRKRVEDELNLVFLGEIGDRKGIFDLLPVIAKLRDKGLNIKLRCAGNGQISRLEATLKEYALEEAVEFLGWINVEQKISEFERADVFVLPSHHEGQPMAILEAMLASVLVISTTAGGIPDTLTDGQEGYLVPAGDQEAMQSILEKVYADIHCADTLVVNAKKKAELQNSPKAVLAKLVTLYKALGMLEGD